MIASKIDATKQDGFLFDGFPRTVEQTVALENAEQEKYEDNMLVLDVDHDEL